MDSIKDDKPGCFGDLDTVFPMGDDGLRESPDKCRIKCPFKTECLKSAIDGMKGDSVQNETVDRNYRAGAIGFLERWSRKKSLNKKDR
jgi:hypothetical protein